MDIQMDPEPLRKLDIHAVMGKKDEIEGEIKELHGVLQSVSCVQELLNV